MVYAGQKYYGIRFSSINLQNNTITIKHKVIETKVNGERKILLKDKTKNSSSYRTLPLVEEVKQALLLQKERIKQNKKLFGNTYNNDYADYVCVDCKGKIFRPEYITDHFAILLRNKGLRHIRFHDLRHSTASLLLSQGIPMKAIQEYLGHSTFSTTANIYSHLEKDSKNVSVKALSNILSA